MHKIRLVLSKNALQIRIPSAYPNEQIKKPQIVDGGVKTRRTRGGHLFSTIETSVWGQALHSYISQTKAARRFRLSKDRTAPNHAPILETLIYTSNERLESKTLNWLTFILGS